MERDTVNKEQILNEAVSISDSINTLGEIWIKLFSL